MFCAGDFVVAEKEKSFWELHRGQINSLMATVAAVMGVVNLGLIIRFMPSGDRHAMSSSLIFMMLMVLILILGVVFGKENYENLLIRNHIYMGLLFGLYVSSFLSGCAMLLKFDARFEELYLLLRTGGIFVFFITMSQYYAYEQTFFDLSGKADLALARTRKILTGIYTIALLFSLCAGLFQTSARDISAANPNNNMVCTAASVIMSVIYAVLTFRRVKNSVIKGTLLCYNLASLIAVPAENLLAAIGHGDHYIWVYSFTAFLSLFLVFCNVYVEQSRRLLKQTSELNTSKLNAMIMQINPHFIYNTLASIDSLIRTDPEKAHQLVLKFSAYLRDNYSSLTSQSMVSFREELKILEHYLEIEQIRFPNLKVIYKIQAVNFKLPGLTVQPLAENAVKHGIRKRRKGEGTLTIESEERANDYVVRIIDDGVGFDAIPRDGKPHIGISNARLRLELLCEGTLNVTSIPQAGTVCEIIIPKKITHEEEEHYYEGTLRG